MYTVPMIGFNQTMFNVAEADGSVDICMYLIPPPGGMECNFTVLLTTQNGKASKLCLSQ